MNLIVTIDTEEDNWGHFSPSGHTVENVRRIPELQRLFDDFDVTPTYLVTYPVAVDETVSAVLRSILAEGRCEIGTHCHPWNTPPFEKSQDSSRDSMLCNLPPHLQYAKIRRLHETVQRTFGIQPVSFRCGRWAFCSDVARHLVDVGYRIDTSVTPYTDWTVDHGPDFSMVPPRPFRLCPDDMPRLPATRHLLEVPATVGFLQPNFTLRSSILRAVRQRPLNRLHLAGLLYRLKVVTKVWLSPEISTTAQMIGLTKRLLRENYSILNLTFHSPSLQAGLTPFVRSGSDQGRLIRRLRDYLTFARACRIAPIKLSDALDLV